MILFTITGGKEMAGNIMVRIQTKDNEDQLFRIYGLKKANLDTVFGRTSPNESDRSVEFTKITFKNKNDLQKAGFGAFEKSAKIKIDPKMKTY